VVWEGRRREASPYPDQYQRLGLSSLGRALLDQGIAATPTSTPNIACKPLPYVFAPLGLLTRLHRRRWRDTSGRGRRVVGERHRLLNTGGWPLSQPAAQQGRTSAIGTVELIDRGMPQMPQPVVSGHKVLDAAAAIAADFN